MLIQNKTRVSKRKIDSQVIGKDNEACKAKKQKTSKGIEEVSDPNPLNLKLKSLQEKHDILVNENKKNLEVISKLKEKVTLLEKGKLSKKSKNL